MGTQGGDPSRKDSFWMFGCFTLYSKAKTQREVCSSKPGAVTALKPESGRRKRKSCNLVG